MTEKRQPNNAMTTDTRNSDDADTLDVNVNPDLFDPIAISESRSAIEPHKRYKRLHIFRPLFVYRQEQVKRMRIVEKRKLRDRKVNKVSSVNRQTPKPCTTYICCQNCIYCENCNRHKRVERSDILMY